MWELAIVWCSTSLLPFSPLSCPTLLTHIQNRSVKLKVILSSCCAYHAFCKHILGMSNWYKIQRYVIQTCKVCSPHHFQLNIQLICSQWIPIFRYDFRTSVFTPLLLFEESHVQGMGECCVMVGTIPRKELKVRMENSKHETIKVHSLRRFVNWTLSKLLYNIILPLLKQPLAKLHMPMVDTAYLHNAVRMLTS